MKKSQKFVFALLLLAMAVPAAATGDGVWTDVTYDWTDDGDLLGWELTGDLSIPWGYWGAVNGIGPAGNNDGLSRDSAHGAQVFTSPSWCGVDSVAFNAQGGVSPTSDPDASGYLGFVLVNDATGQVVGTYTRSGNSHSWIRQTWSGVSVGSECFHIEMRDDKSISWAHIWIQNVVVTSNSYSTAPTSATPEGFVLGQPDFQGTTCQQGGSVVMDKQTCMEYAKTVRCDWASETYETAFRDLCFEGQNEGWCSDRPAGCWTDSRGTNPDGTPRQCVYFTNPDQTSVPVDGGTPVCEIDDGRGASLVSQAFVGHRNNYNGEVGYSFTAKTELDVYGIGRANGAGAYYQDVAVTLWDAQTQQAIASATIGPNTINQVTIPDPKGFTYASVASVRLEAGKEYRLTQNTFNGMYDKWDDAVHPNNYPSSWISNVEGAYTGANNAYPSSNAEAHRFAGMLTLLVEEAEPDCLGVIGGDAEELACGCNDDNSCRGCDGIANSGLVDDDCSVCGGNNQNKDCAGECFGSSVVDVCGVCGGDGWTCTVVDVDDDTQLWKVEGDTVTRCACGTCFINDGSSRIHWAPAGVDSAFAMRSADDATVAAVSGGSWSASAKGLSFAANDGAQIEHEWPVCDCEDEPKGDNMGGGDKGDNMGGGDKDEPEGDDRGNGDGQGHGNMGGNGGDKGDNMGGGDRDSSSSDSSPGRDDEGDVQAPLVPLAPLGVCYAISTPPFVNGNHHMGGPSLAACLQQVPASATLVAFGCPGEWGAFECWSGNAVQPGAFPLALEECAGSPSQDIGHGGQNGHCNGYPIGTFTQNYNGAEIVLGGWDRKPVYNVADLQKNWDTPVCIDDPVWASSTQATCADYVANQWCENGSYGAGWDKDFGPFANWAVNGVDASQACCECGGEASAGN